MEKKEETIMPWFRIDDTLDPVTRATLEEINKTWSVEAEEEQDRMIEEKWQEFKRENPEDCPDPDDEEYIYSDDPPVDPPLTPLNAERPSPPWRDF
jgi:hypothetical protein